MHRGTALLLIAVTLPGATAFGQSSAPPALSWHDGQKLNIDGKGWTDTENYYERLPARAKGLVTDAVWRLSKNTAGLCLRFATDSPRIAARWTLTSEGLAMNHMPATGMSGVDLYVKRGDTWQFLGNGRPAKQANEGVLASGIPSTGSREYLLYLPLYNGIKSLEVGLAPDATLTRPAPRGKAVCVYGTSITQGGCASRPGMAHVAILGRKLNRPTINLGFSGSGKMEPAMADLLAELDVAAYVLDCLPNMTAEMVSERLIPFVEKLRQVRPDTPIVLLENVEYPHSRVLPEARATLSKKNRALREAYRKLSAAGTGKLTYVPWDHLLGDDGEGTVDGVHPTDLGFLRFADALTTVLSGVLTQ